jgi:TonB family protein
MIDMAIISFTNNYFGFSKTLKAILILYASIHLTSIINAQEKITLYYNSNWEITRKEKATYFREAEFDLNNFKLDGTVMDFSITGTPIMKGKYNSDKKDGDFIFYYENGNIKSKGKYDNDRRVGYWEYNYNDNKLKQKVLFPQGTIKKEISVVEYYDKAGNQVIKNGTGIWIQDSINGGSLDQSSLCKLSGQFKDSLMTGEWKLTRLTDKKLIHTERFRKGKFIEATVYEPMFDSYGTTNFEMLDKFPDENSLRLKKIENFKIDSTVFSSSLIYSDVETIFKTVTGKDYKIKNRNASYAYGDNALFEFIGTNLKYPISAIESRTSGKVYVSVVIDSLGKTKEVKLLKGVRSDLDAEALRVIRLITNWLPAIKDGKATESTFSIPVKFEIKQ